MGQEWNKEHKEFTKFMKALSDFFQTAYMLQEELQWEN